MSIQSNSFFGGARSTVRAHVHSVKNGKVAGYLCSNEENYLKSFNVKIKDGVFRVGCVNPRTGRSILLHKFKFDENAIL